jgi:hypothetical protein
MQPVSLAKQVWPSAVRPNVVRLLGSVSPSVTEGMPPELATPELVADEAAPLPLLSLAGAGGGGVALAAVWF